ncbi:MAG: hypothetical protein LUE14_01885 [Clostridiales bacterium]|nr:hypothetical protein [Clostridiales bacterium]MCD8108844.1 hypothetical protein [Clostridiales bacterium]MCD8132472.1 hypothetical protein [Clostridiales bacterium]
MRNKHKNNGYALMVELQNYEQQGISIWLEGCPSSSADVMKAIRVREGISYMRDYVFQSGELSEVRFDKITKS